MRVLRSRRVSSDGEVTYGVRNSFPARDCAGHERLCEARDDGVANPLFTRKLGLGLG